MFCVNKLSKKNVKSIYGTDWPPEWFMHYEIYLFMRLCMYSIFFSVVVGFTVLLGKGIASPETDWVKKNTDLSRKKSDTIYYYLKTLETRQLV